MGGEEKSYVPDLFCSCMGIYTFIEGNFLLFRVVYCKLHVRIV